MLYQSMFNFYANSLFRPTPGILRASYPETDSNTSSTTTTTALAQPVNRKRTDYAAQSNQISQLNYNSLPAINKVRDTSYQYGNYYNNHHHHQYNGPSNGNAKTSGNNARENDEMDDNGYFLRTYGNYRKGDYPVLKYVNLCLIFPLIKRKCVAF